MRTGNASGIQILFLSFAVILLAVPLSGFIAATLESTRREAEFIGRFMPFLLGALVLLGFPPLRQRTRTYLATPIPVDRRVEVLVAALAKVPLGFAFVGLLALWHWMTEGSAALSYRFGSASAEAQRAEAFSMPGMLTSIVLGALIAPLIEEVLYRGLLFDAWSRRWGPLAATVFTSALFACYHPNVLAAFASAVLFTCLVRRTGTLWSSIAVHSFFNLMLWYPFAGQFLIPDPAQPLGDLTTWKFHLACLVVAAVALPAYILLAIFRPYEPPVELR